MLGAESRDVGSDIGVIPVPLEKCAGPVTRIAEQRPMDEFDGRRRALDVEEDGADVPQRTAARTGMYAGPMHSG
jgi:hypothetical protein